MAVPTLTPEQRAEALAKARAARAARAKVVEDLKANKTTIAKVIDDAASDKTLGKMRVIALITSQPGYGKVKASQLMEELGIASNRTIGGLGVRQAKALKEAFAE